MPEKDSTLWAWLAAGLAAFGGYLRYYFANRGKAMGMEWWSEALIDVAASVFIGIVVFLIASPITGETAAAGMAGYAGHIGTRNTVLFIRNYIIRKR